MIATFPRMVVALCCVLVFGYLLSWPLFSTEARWPVLSNYIPDLGFQRIPADCPTSSLVKDIFVVLKTGATESWRVKAHVETELRCIPHYMVISDIEEHRDGLHIHDILKDYPDDVRQHAPEFGFRRTLLEYQAAGKPMNQSLAFPNGPGIKEDNLAWKLDKWKFIPMVQKAVKEQPLAKWYVFFEADTYLVWSNLLPFLELFDYNQPYYIGAPNSFPGIGFVNGGSGIILSSQVAMVLSSYTNVHPRLIYDMTEEDCCGDALIARVLKLLDLETVGAWPHIQGETPESQDYTERHWCYPVVSFHHMHPDVILQVGEFERTWIQNGGGPITHRDIFEEFVRPKLSSRRFGWDNRSGRRPPSDNEKDENGEEPDDGPSSASYETCSEVCKKDSKCVQFSWKPGQCRTSDWFALGREDANSEMSSGYFLDRIESYIADLGLCEPPSWMKVDRNSEMPPKDEDSE